MRFSTKFPLYIFYQHTEHQKYLTFLRNWSLKTDTFILEPTVLLSREPFSRQEQHVEN